MVRSSYFLDGRLSRRHEMERKEYIIIGFVLRCQILHNIEMLQSCFFSLANSSWF